MLKRKNGCVILVIDGNFMTADCSNNADVPGLKLDRYRRQIKLDESYDPQFSGNLSDGERDDTVDRLLDVLINQEALSATRQIPGEYQQKRRLLRALLNVRPPDPMDTAFLEKINRLLQEETREKEIFDCRTFQPVFEFIQASGLNNAGILFLWKGDITCLLVDAIVNAANNRMLGCFQPLHNCIDNVIHSAAGPLLRQDCRIIMDISNCPEQTGDAKITRAYNLPSKYVLHTVGPIVQHKEVSEYQADQLASSYRSCLSLADRVQDIRSIAFPCISTGVYNFPKDLAAEIAVAAVDEWLESNPHHFTHVIFNVFLDEDFNCYARTFRRYNN